MLQIFKSRTKELQRVGIHGIKRILIIKLRYLGDTLTLLPVIHSIKKSFPSTAVDVLVEKPSHEILSFHPDIDNVFVFDRETATKNSYSMLKYYKSLIKNLRSREYDLAIDYTFADRSAVIQFLTGAKYRVTYHHGSNLSKLLQNIVLTSDFKTSHVVDVQLKVLELLGIKERIRKIQLHVDQGLEDKVKKLLRNKGRYSFTVAIHPGAQRMVRVWRPERYSEICERLIQRYQANVVLIAGPNESELLKRIRDGISFEPLYCGTDLNLKELAAMIKQCDFFLGSDSGPAHVAAGVGVPTITLFGPTYPQTWLALSDPSLYIHKELECCGCRQLQCIRPHNSCMDQITVEEVWEKVEEMVSILKNRGKIIRRQDVKPGTERAP